MRKKETEKKTNVLRHRWYRIPELLVFGARSSSDVLVQIDQWLSQASAAQEKSGLIKRLAYDSQQQFNGSKSLPDARIALTAYGESELQKKLAQMRKMIADRPQASFSFPSAGLFYGVGAPRGKVAYLFAGQGAQYLGMGAALADAFPAARRAWETLGKVRFNGQSVKEIVFPPENITEEEAKAAFMRLSGADWTNPSIAVVGEAIFNLLEEMGVRPDAVAAHSFGDVAALRAAGIISGEDMLKATRHRGELGVACPQATRGCILIVPASAERTHELLTAHHIDHVWIANFNTRGQTVLSGVKAGVYKAHKVFGEQGIQSRLIPISAAPHCPLAVEVAELFYDYLLNTDFKKADCDVYSFLFGRKVNNDPDLYRKLLKAHVEKPVSFLQQIEQMHLDGIRTFIEVGPSDVLTGLVGQILEDKPHVALNTDHRKGDAVLIFLNTVAELFKENRIKDLAPLWEGYGLPRYPHSEEGGRDAMVVDIAKQLTILDLEFAKIEKARLMAQAV